LSSLIWMVVGLGIYFSYSRKKSNLHQWQLFIRFIKKLLNQELFLFCNISNSQMPP
jgi:hypothetical protein